eukprot:11324036-Alexandrium_andersonii.AAC.1
MCARAHACMRASHHCAGAAVDPLARRAGPLATACAPHSAESEGVVHAPHRPLMTCSLPPVACSL